MINLYDISLIKEKDLYSIFDVCNENKQGRSLLLYRWGENSESREEIELETLTSF